MDDFPEPHDFFANERSNFKEFYLPDLQEEATNTVLMLAELLCAEWVA